MSMGFGGFGSVGNAMFRIVPIIIGIGFVVVLVILVVSAVRGASQWHKNNGSPALTVAASVVTKRENITHHHSDSSLGRTHTTYYATFELESGDRMEFCVASTEYGVLAEGDNGTLRFQGTRYRGFDRVREQ